jgi:uncharacterized membrane protein
MLPDPLHPAVVHFPIVFTFLLPLAAGFAIWRIRRGAQVLRAWPLTVVLAAALSISAWVAVETGERDEDGAERIVGDAPMHGHEEAAERFLLLSGGLLAVAGAGLLRGRVGALTRLAAAVGAVGMVAVGAQVGHSGGELVYRHGAASAHVPGGNTVGDAPVEVGRSARGRDD